MRNRYFHCPTCDEVVTPDTDGQYVHCAHEWGRSDLIYRGLIFHDLRRSAVRGLIRAGVSQKVAMSISGHKTISVFQRYQIVSPADKQEATRMLEASQERERERLKSQAIPFGQDSGIVARKRTENSAISTVATQPGDSS